LDMERGIVKQAEFVDALVECHKSSNMVKSLAALHQGIDVNSDEATKGYPPIHIVLRNTHVWNHKTTSANEVNGDMARSLVTALLDEKADVNALDHNRRTPLMAASTVVESDAETTSASNQAEVADAVNDASHCGYLIRLLLARRADVAAQDNRGLNVLHHLAQKHMSFYPQSQLLSELVTRHRADAQLFQTTDTRLNLIAALPRDVCRSAELKCFIERLMNENAMHLRSPLLRAVPVSALVEIILGYYWPPATSLTFRAECVTGS